MNVLALGGWAYFEYSLIIHCNTKAQIDKLKQRAILPITGLIVKQQKDWTGLYARMMRHTTTSQVAAPSSKGLCVVTQGLAGCTEQYHGGICTEAEVHESNAKTANASDDAKIRRRYVFRQWKSGKLSMPATIAATSSSSKWNGVKSDRIIMKLETRFPGRTSVCQSLLFS